MRPSTALLLVCLAVVPARLLSQGGGHRYPPASSRTAATRVQVGYDPQYDKTLVRLDDVALDSTLSVSMLTALDGRPVRKEADGVVLTFCSTGEPSALHAARNVTLIVDGKQADLGEAWLVPQPRPGCSEIAMKAVPLDVWLTLPDARSVRLRIGARELTLSAATLNEIRAFASWMAPQ